MTGMEAAATPSGFTEPFNAFTHLIGAGIFLAWAVLLVMRGRGGPDILGGGQGRRQSQRRGKADAAREKKLRMAALSVFGLAAVTQLLASGIYHLLEKDHLPRIIMQRVDHSAIFFLILASFVPLHTILFRGWRRWGVLSGMLILTSSGMAISAVFLDIIPDWVSTTVYVSIGWVGGYSAYLLHQRHHWGFILPLVWGGVAYTIGGAMEFLRWPVVVKGVVEGHEMSHLAVLAGLTFHFWFTWSFAKGEPQGGVGKAKGRRAH
ncbi:MAG: hemolysin III family protein [Deltaproteobacteria bacterium]|nr:hemolysin III family protein [Deltaproteobacteria bacterium]